MKARAGPNFRNTSKTESIDDLAAGAVPICGDHIATGNIALA